MTLALVTAAAAWPQESAATLENPFTSDADVARGERIFASQCASCHGLDGRGTSAAPDLSTGQFRRASSDEGLHRIIGQGIPGTTMPAFSLNPGPTWQVVGYIRSLSRNRRNLATSGDAARGASLFEKNCKGCHAASAPSLAGLARRRSLDDLRTAILNPSKDVNDTYWRIRITMRDGRVLSGVRLNEDTFTIQVRDDKGVLRSIRRDAAARIEYDRTSPMPSFQDKLSDAELNDILAHIAGIQAP